jgi:hydrogenase expression/formation protein HypD
MSDRAPQLSQARAIRSDMAGLRDEIGNLCRHIGRPVRIMEVCGTHTVAVFRSGIRSMLPGSLRLISGPGCPVCVTAQRDIDAAIELASRPRVIIATYGDMVRVPGSLGSLERRRAEGADVRVVASANTALRIAERNKDRDVVFLGVGFETTAPATAAVVLAAARQGVENFSALVSHKLVVPAMRALLSAGDVPLDGFLCPGHVSVIIGSEAYRSIVSDFAKPCVVAGFEPHQILHGLARLLRQIVRGEAKLENVYTAAAAPHGNRIALELLREVFVVRPAVWRELGEIPNSGLSLAPPYERYDAARRFGIVLPPERTNPACICGLVIQGRVEPRECRLFGNTCTPLTPIGPCMVSSEGTCAAWFKYGTALDRQRERILNDSRIAEEELV